MWHLYSVFTDDIYLSLISLNFLCKSYFFHATILIPIYIYIVFLFLVYNSVEKRMTNQKSGDTQAWGWMEWKEGNLNTARELYQKALSIDSNSESAARCLQVINFIWMHINVVID